jgi:hypothetical protein
MLHLTSVTLNIGLSQRGLWASIWGALRRMPSLTDLAFTGCGGTNPQPVDVKPVSQLTQLQRFSLNNVAHNFGLHLDYNCLSALTGLTHLVLSVPAKQPGPQRKGQQQEEQQLEAEYLLELEEQQLEAHYLLMLDRVELRHPGLAVHVLAWSSCMGPGGRCVVHDGGLT